jgi:phage terminase large subunit-like protein
MIELLEEKARRFVENTLSRVLSSLYPWQRRFNAATKDNLACMLMAANRVGKTYTGCAIDAVHLTGDYPDDWDGYVFKKPILAWLLGYSGEKTRDLLQTALFGRFLEGKFEGGLISKDRILDWRSMTGTSGAMREVRVKHKYGTSTCQFWSYTQGQHALMGDSVDWYHIDEEPKDRNIIPQVLTRTATGDSGKGGRGILTFTPENGRTEVVVKFMDDPAPSQYLQRATWDDAPHLTEETKESLLAMYPAWQRDMRTKGLPLMGAGLIYDMSPDSLKMQPIECPDHWWVIDGMDFGFDHPQAHIQLWWDKDDDIFYLAKAWKKSRVLPTAAWSAVKPWAENVPTAWPMDGLQHEKGSGKQQKDYYETEGFKMLPDHATWQGGGVGVEAGLVELYRLMEDGRFKVFSHIVDFFDELISYHRDENGKIAKVGDDILDAVRYAYMMRRHAVQKCKIKDPRWAKLPTKRRGII